MPPKKAARPVSPAPPPVVEAAPPSPEPPPEEVAVGQMWKWIKKAQYQELIAIQNPTDVISTLAGFLDLPNSKTDSRESILADFHFYNWAFSQTQGFGDAQTSAFIGIMKEMVDAMRPGTDTAGTLNEAMQLFRQLMIQHSAGAPPECLKLFNVRELQAITEFVTRTLFQHFELYKYVLSEPPEVLVHHQECPVQTALPVAPLATGEDYTVYKTRTEQEQLAREEAERLEQAQAEEADRVRAAQETTMMSAEEEPSRNNTLYGEMMRPPFTAEKIQQLSAAVAARQLQALKADMMRQMMEQQQALLARIEELSQPTAGKKK